MTPAAFARALAGIAVKLFSPPSAPPPALNAAIARVDALLVEARREREELERLVNSGAPGALVANILNTHARLRGPRDV